MMPILVISNGTLTVRSIPKAENVQELNGGIKIFVFSNQISEMWFVHLRTPFYCPFGLALCISKTLRSCKFSPPNAMPLTDDELCPVSRPILQETSITCC